MFLLEVDFENREGHTALSVYWTSAGKQFSTVESWRREGAFPPCLCLSPCFINLINLSAFIHTSPTWPCLCLFFSVTVPPLLSLFLPSCLLLPARETLWIRALSSVSKHPRVISVSLRSANWYSRHALAAYFVQSRVPVSQTHLSSVIILRASKQFMALWNLFDKKCFLSYYMGFSNNMWKMFPTTWTLQ